MAKLDLLEGMKVVDFSSYVAGPTCAKLLGEYGAEVIRIEPHIGDSVRFIASQMMHVTNGDNPFYDVVNGNKRQICLETRKPEGLEVLHRLLKDADVFVCNMREPQAKRIGLDFDTLHAKYPKLVYANVTGYGTQGINEGKPGFDGTAYFTRPGLNYAVLPDGSEPIMPYPGLGDIPTGTYLALGVLAAYTKAQRTGEGDFVSVSLYGAGMWTAVCPIVFAQAPYSQDLDKDRQKCVPLVRHYRTKDNRWLMVNSGNWERDWPRFAAATGFEPELVEQTARHLQVAPRAKELAPRFEALFASETYDYWDKKLIELDISHELCQTFEEIINDPVAITGNLLQEVHYPVSGTNPRLVRSPAQFRLAGAPDTELSHTVGQDTVDVMTECGYTEEEIAALKEKKVIGMAGDPDVFDISWSSKFGD